MSKKYGFLSGLDEDKQKPKLKYQLFEAEIGFERAKVIIPLDQAEAFEQEATSKPPKSVASLTKLAAKFGGQLDG